MSPRPRRKPVRMLAGRRVERPIIVRSRPLEEQEAEQREAITRRNREHWQREESRRSA